MAQARTPVFVMDADQLALWARSLAENNSVDITPAGARRLARKIKRKGITGTQLQGKSLSELQKLFGADWDPHIVRALHQAFGEAVDAKYRSVIAHAHDDESKSEEIPQRFRIQVQVGGHRAISLEVNTSWTCREFKQVLRDREGVHQCGLLVMGRVLSDDDESRTLAQLDFRPGTSVRTLFKTMGGNDVTYEESCAARTKYKSVGGGGQ